MTREASHRGGPPFIAVPSERLGWRQSHSSPRGGAALSRRSRFWRTAAASSRWALALVRDKSRGGGSFPGGPCNTLPIPVPSHRRGQGDRQTAPITTGRRAFRRRMRTTTTRALPTRGHRCRVRRAPESALGGLALRGRKRRSRVELERRRSTGRSGVPEPRPKPIAARPRKQRVFAAAMRGRLGAPPALPTALVERVHERVDAPIGDRGKGHHHTRDEELIIPPAVVVLRVPVAWPTHRTAACPAYRVPSGEGRRSASAGPRSSIPSKIAPYGGQVRSLSRGSTSAGSSSPRRSGLQPFQPTDRHRLRLHRFQPLVPHRPRLIRRLVLHMPDIRVGARVVPAEVTVV